MPSNCSYSQELSSAGYKTIAVAAGIEGEGMHFLGLLPMLVRTMKFGSLGFLCIASYISFALWMAADLGLYRAYR